MVVKISSLNLRSIVYRNKLYIVISYNYSRSHIKETCLYIIVIFVNNYKNM